MVPRTAVVTVLLALALAAAGGTVWKLVTLPEVGSVRYAADDPRSELSRAEQTIRDVVDATGSEASVAEALGASLKSKAPGEFPGATYWDEEAVAFERNTWLAAGAIAVGALLGCAAIGAFAGPRLAPRGRRR